MDYRVIVIDNAVYSSVSDASSRARAIDDMLSDIRMFALDQNRAKEKTFVILKSGTSVRELRAVIGETDPTRVAEEIADLKELGEIEEGRFPQAEGLSGLDLRSALFRLIDSEGIKGSLDLHIFARDWTLPIDGHTTGKMDRELPSACVARFDTSPSRLSRAVQLTVEFRAPDGSDRPSPATEAGLIALLTGTALRSGSILTRGSVGPLCNLTKGEVAIPFDPNPNGVLDCNPSSPSSFEGRYVACKAPQVPAMGSPVRRGNQLVAWDAGLVLDRVETVDAGTPPGLAVAASVANVPLVTGTQVDLSGKLAPGTYSPALDIRPGPGCTGEDPVMLRLNGSAGSLQSVFSPSPCLDDHILLPEIEVR